ncbi:MFS transporter [Oceanospirillum sediminis]|uniref:MFS transporter n=1 Tax=Oceanospirillum sediminis TaxID=2760088 RepID=A0A839INZ3_9GAMM|nr:MFS transporter [Oceanospirillum sediminis]MBB1486621.1 MFS transporter [Oceanospirillum sediminis]
MTDRADGLTGFINRRLLILTLISTILASVISAVYTLTEFNISLKPLLVQKASAVAEVVREDTTLAVDAGVPFHKIKGMDTYLSETVEKYPELTYLTITTDRGDIVYQGGNVPDFSFQAAMSLEQGSGTQNVLQASFLTRLLQGGMELTRLLPLGEASSIATENVWLPLEHDNQRYGAVHVGLDSGFIRTQLTDVFFDIAIVLVAVLLVSFEVVMVVVMFYVSGPVQKSEALLKRQASGDFSVNQNLAGSGSIGRYIRRLNEDSEQLQQRFRKTLAQIGEGQGGVVSSPEEIIKEDRPSTNPVRAQLRKLAERFSLLNVLKEQHGNIMDARIPLFVFAFAEELQKSFMPLFVAEFYEPNPWFSKDIVMGLPISVFMFVIAAATPFAGSWVDRWGNKRLFFWGLIPALAGYLGCAFASDVYDIIFWRGVTALGYAIITISCQGYIAAIVSSDNRAKGMAIFVGVLMTATMCGTALGGIIADRIGYQPVFLLSAILAAFAGILAWMMLSSDVDKANKKDAEKAGAGGGALTLFRNPQFAFIVLFCAIPAKIILTGFLYYMVPLYLVSLDASQSEIGRIMMVYSLVIIPLSPLASRFADYSGQMKQLVVLGTILSGVILISLYGEDSIGRMLLAVALMGVAHSILKAPLIAAAMEAAEATPEVGRTTALGLLRTSERIGSVLGPVMVASLLVVYSFAEAMAIIGTGIVITGIVMGIYMHLSARKQEITS